MLRVAGRLRRRSPAAAATELQARLEGLRFLNVHEYQGADLLRASGVNVPPGIACRTVEEVNKAAATLGGAAGEVVVKSQVLAGGRGLGSFTNGLKGGVHVVKARTPVRPPARRLGCGLTLAPRRPRLARSPPACWAARW